MKKLMYGLVAGLTFLSSVSFAKDLNIFVRRRDDNNIIQVANKEALEKNYDGDTFLHYRKEKGKWVLDHITYTENEMYIRKFVCYITEEEIPTYVDGIYSLYYDPDQDEESLVAIFDEGIDSKVKDAWIEMAKKHVKEINES